MGDAAPPDRDPTGQVRSAHHAGSARTRPLRLAQFLRAALFRTPIPANVAVSYAHDAGESIFLYDDRSGAARAYMAFVKELLERIYKPMGAN